MHQIILPLDAAILGVVEGLTEFLPVSSTGHLILTSKLLRLADSDGVKAFEVVIQAGALLAVVGIYMRSIKAMLLGVMGKNPEGLALLTQLVVAFLPAAIVGKLFNHAIKEHLFGLPPVIVAWAVGGVLMLGVESWRRRRLAPPESKRLSLASMTLQAAFIIGCAQCIAMWPGTSRSMITIVAALLLGFNMRAAAEFSFLLALPTLSAATLYDFYKEHHAIMQATQGSASLVIGFVVSFIVAWIAVKSFLAYLTSHSMSVFGWYRIALAVVVTLVIWSGLTAL